MNRTNNYQKTQPYKTKDGSEIRELIHPSLNINSNQSIAEARIKALGTTKAHYHKLSEEIYLTTQGTGKLYIQKGQGDDVIEINLQKGTSAVILPGEIHWLTNTGEGVLVILCCCSPPYSHTDTLLA
jgi:mannose-6-phosphate isomerase-like protein (cupin superfamily)